jgi:putative two-component system response regulator
LPNIDEEALLDSRILLADDNPVNVTLLERLLAKNGYRNVTGVTSSTQAEEICLTDQPDLLILDLHMPVKDGYEVLQSLRSQGALETYLPILVFTADVTPEARRRALSLGASDFLTKPGDALEIGLRVKNFLKMRHLYRELEHQNQILENKVQERTRSLQEAQLEIVARLALVGDYRDDETGEHCKRVAEMSFELALQIGVKPQTAELIRLAAPLHDIGKVGIPDAVIRKPARLTEEEFREIKTHTTIGASILEGSHSELLRMAYTIAISHHERWDGRGYPHGLAGEEIPLPGRIVSVADVFDALSNPRPYKEPWPLDKTLAEITNGAGTQFDPQVVEALHRVLHARSDLSCLRQAA